MQLDERKTDAIVIGGGMAGLASATYLARQGKRVRLIEQSTALGGRARTKIQDGFYWNIGPHALYRGGRGIEVLRELGIEPTGGAPPVSGAFAIKGSVKYTFPAGFVSLLATSLFELSAKLEAARVLGSIKKINAALLMNVTVRDWLDEQISHPSVKELLLATLRLATYTNAPEIMSAGAAIEQFQKALEKSVLYLDGGWQTLVDGLGKAAAESGVIVETGAKAQLIERNGAGAARAVRLADGRVYEAHIIIVASSPSAVVNLVERAASTSLAKWAETATPVKAACLDVALDRLPRPKATFALGIDSPLYLSVHSASARLAPGDGALIHVAKYLPSDSDESPDGIERELEDLLELAQPEWREALVCKRFLPEITVMNAMPTARFDGTRGRPGPEVPDVAGLYVVGDWVGKEGLLADASLASAKRASELIAGYRSISLTAAM